MKKLSFLAFFLIINNLCGQNYSIQETVDYINTLTTFNVTCSENMIKLYGKWGIYINDIGEVTTGRPIRDGYDFKRNVIYLNCLNNKENCAYYGKEGNLPFLFLYAENISEVEKVANAFRYLIDKVKESNIADDPFSSYGKYNQSLKTSESINIDDLHIGMTKESVFKTLNTKLIVESIESGYEVYKAKKEEQYFLYFTNNRLTRVDKGKSIYDAIIYIGN